MSREIVTPNGFIKKVRCPRSISWLTFRLARRTRWGSTGASDIRRWRPCSQDSSHSIYSGPCWSTQWVVASCVPLADTPRPEI